MKENFLNNLQRLVLSTSKEVMESLATLRTLQEFQIKFKNTTVKPLTWVLEW